MTNQAEVEAFAQAVNVSRETLDRLKAYREILLKWNKRINLIGRSTEDRIWTRHFLDSAQLLALAPSGARRWLDLGSGAGFPGLVIAALAAELRPELRMTLVDSDLRKTIFLREAANAIDLDPTILNSRCQDLAPLDADVISARALAPLPDLLTLAVPHAAENCTYLFPKGGSAQTELTASRRLWHMTEESIQSVTDPGGAILRLGDVKHA